MGPEEKLQPVGQYSNYVAGSADMRPRNRAASVKITILGAFYSASAYRSPSIGGVLTSQWRELESPEQHLMFSSHGKIQESHHQLK
jgi:hypothetical protein